LPFSAIFTALSVPQLGGSLKKPLFSGVFTYFLRDDCEICIKNRSSSQFYILLSLNILHPEQHGFARCWRKSKKKRILAKFVFMKATALSPKRRLWLMRLFAMILVPLFVLGVAELGLRLAGYGYQAAKE
jgi:hypothetical protein